MDPSGAAELAAARVVALYLLSLVALAGADLAWRPASLARLCGHAAFLLLTVLLGGLLKDASSAWAAAAARRRVRLVALLFLPLPGFFALVAALAAPAIAPRAVAALAALQLLLLLVADALSLELVAVWGALALTLLAGAAGGLVAIVTLPGFVLLAGVFFSLDYATKRLAAWTRVQPPPLRLLLASALGAAAPPAVLLGAALVVLPAPAAPGLAGGQAPAVSGEVGRAYRWLSLLAAIGGTTTLVAMRWLRGGGGEESLALVELPESHVLAEERLEPGSPDDPRYAAARGRVIRAYLRFLDRANDAGLRLERTLTPREIEERVRHPADPLGTLTDLFMDARYGPREPAPEAVLRAEAASREAISGLHARRAPRASPWRSSTA
jgi:hypothetical protein